jgi:Transcriptional regulatory protein, C terminal/AAA ATPase domain
LVELAMPTERFDRAKVEAGADRSPERLPKFSETVRSGGSDKPVQALSMGDRIVDLDRDALLDRQGAVVPLRPRAWLVLKFLAQRAGRLVEKNELLEEVWADCVVTEDSLVQAIGDIRRALGDTGRTALRTLPRRGYILVPEQLRAPSTGVNIGNHLRARAERRFVGRDCELAELGNALVAESGGVQLYFVHGPGGIGKTTLLERFRGDAMRAGIVCASIDGSAIASTPAAVAAAIAEDLAVIETAATLQDICTAMTSSDCRLLLIDSFDAMEETTGWVRETLLPALPTHVRIVVAGRNAPDTLWTAHPLWSEATRCIQLSSLSREESSRLLEVHSIDNTAQDAILELSHGHPLALVLLAAEIRKHGRIPSSLGRDTVRELIKRCVSGAPTPLHRRALEVAARARTTTVALLADVVDPHQASILFDWLSEQCYMNVGARGLSPHDLVRDVVDEDLRWRDPEGSRKLDGALNRCLLRQLRDGRHGSHTAMELQFLERKSVLMKQYFDFGALGSISIETAIAADRDGIARLRDAALPPAEREMFDLWFGHPATRTFVARRPSGSVCGVTLIVELDRVDGVTADKDPIVSAIRRSLGHLLLSADGVSLVSRFTIPEGDRRDLSPAMNALQICHLMHWATEQDLHFWIIVAHHPDHFAPLLAAIHFERLPDCDRSFGGMPVGCFAHDWKSEPWLIWRARSSPP